MWTMTDCVTAAAASLGPYDGVQCSGVWPTAWLLLLLHWGRMTTLCCPDYGRLRDCCWCFIGAVWLRYVVRTMADCVTAVAASLGPHDCVMLSGLWPTAWLLLLLHWGRMTALCCPDYGRLRDCCCCLIGPYDGVQCSGLWLTAWLLLLLHWGRMTARWLSPRSCAQKCNIIFKKYNSFFWFEIWHYHWKQSPKWRGYKEKTI